MAAGAMTSPATAKEDITLTVKWSGKEYTLRVCADNSVADLKRRICRLTNVLPNRQKLLYPKIGSKLSDDSTLLSTLSLKSSLKMTMIGTVEDDIIVDQVDAPEIVDDFGIVVDIKDKEVNKQKLRGCVEQYKACSLLFIELRNPCREGKKLLVLDIDYTLFDHHSKAENPLDLMRPCKKLPLISLENIKMMINNHKYDIIIWSATSMKKVEWKMGVLGVLNNPSYKITALLDNLAMIRVQSDSRDDFRCKPLGLIWAHFPEFYSSKNTIMFDDVQKNFVMNPHNGLTIKPFKKAHANRDSDVELVKLAQYLLAIADLDDISILDHMKWESYDEANFKRRRHK
ncbi:hypothetical protein OSB04_030934 [Centaurea solstitialis]|uniref:protein-serine/threonine phosphatase n=1 Tax=Centaurea solstitialis TaxID=347529 RepID=A0AA38SLP6_9ASTR|nr:hypothetical protein OSB04_030934 [Centaurea solstitialis]